MVIDSRLIRFPLPDNYGPIFINQNFETLPYGIAYQYDIDQYGYSSYGFDDDKIEPVLNSLLDSYCYIGKDGILIKANECDLHSGIYIQESIEDNIKKFNARIKTYLLKIRYNIKNIDDNNADLKAVLNVYHREWHGYLVDADIFKFLSSQQSTFVIEYYGMAPGASIITLDESIWSFMSQSASSLGLEVAEIPSTNILKDH